MLEYLAPLKILARKAGQVIMPYFAAVATLDIRHKADASPLTAADLAAHDVIVTQLQALTPGIPILSEESAPVAFEERQKWQRYWLVDPLDGTRGFIAGSPEFTLNIALIEQGEPVLAVIYAPSLQICYYAARGYGAFREIECGPAEPIHGQPFCADHYRVWLGRNETGAVAFLPGCEVLRSHSAIKFCKLAEGLGDVYPRFGQTGEWDTAAGQCILEAAGGCVVDFNLQPLRYNQKASLQNPAFVALGDARAATCVIELIQQRRNV